MAALNVPVKDPVRNVELRPQLSVGVDVGFSTLVYAAVSTGPQRTHWGSQEDYMDFRRRIQARKGRLQQFADGSRGGHGRKRKLKAADAVQDKEQRFIRSYNHTASKRIVDFAFQQRAGTIKMEDLTGIKDAETNTFLYRNWRYADLQVMIENKAKRHGIRVLYVDPAYTSQTCSKCGNVDKTQRQGAQFKCSACGEQMHADYNAAINIARSEKALIRKQQQPVAEQTEGTLATEYDTAGPTAEG